MEGIRSWHRDIWLAHRRAGIPILLVEYGYLARASAPDNHAERFWQLSVNNLGWVPPDNPGATRFSDLGITPQPWRQASEDKPVILCGDNPGGIDVTDDFRWPQIRYWALTALAQIRLATKRRVFWRPHPAMQAMIPGFNGLSVGDVAWRDVWAVVTHNSNTGNEALFAGCPVFTDGCAGYRELSAMDLAQVETPRMPQRQDYFERLAWAQWTLAEIRTGEPFAEYLNRGWIR